MCSHWAWDARGECRDGSSQPPVASTLAGYLRHSAFVQRSVHELIAHCGPRTGSLIRKIWRVDTSWFDVAQKLANGCERLEWCSTLCMYATGNNHARVEGCITRATEKYPDSFATLAHAGWRVFLDAMKGLQRCACAMAANVPPFSAQSWGLRPVAFALAQPSAGSRPPLVLPCTHPLPSGHHDQLSPLPLPPTSSGQTVASVVSALHFTLPLQPQSLAAPAVPRSGGRSPQRTASIHHARPGFFCAGIVCPGRYSSNKYEYVV